MSKFNTSTARPQALSFITSEKTPSGTTFEGGAGFSRDTKSELFLLAVSEFAGESTFYESADTRSSRLGTLVSKVAVEDLAWTTDFLSWLRSSGNLRTVAISAAVYAVKARLDAGLSHNRHLISVVCQRADEPGEVLAAWTSRYGRAIPKPVKRGVADAVQRLYNERSLLKYDTDKAGFRFGDVLELVHARPDTFKEAWQPDLFQHAIDRRHGRGEEIPESLETLRARQELMALPVADRRKSLHPGKLDAAGMTWEALAGWLQGPMDKAAWEAVIPTMGYMALLRNLRNFDEAGVSDGAAAAVAAKLSAPDQVARSRQLPMRFLSAYRAAPSLRWSWALEQALDHSLQNVPVLSGRTLILVDTSSSMNSQLSARSDLKRWDAAAVFGLALGRRAANADVVSYSSAQVYWGDPKGPRSKEYTMRKGESLLSMVARWDSDGYFLGGGTDTAGAVQEHFAGHDRVVLLTDEQTSYRSERGVFHSLPKGVPTYTWNLAGYAQGHDRTGESERHTFGGLTDASFKIIPLIEAGRNGRFPWQD